jgi:hypothetical protein
LTAHRQELERVAAELLERETLDGSRFYQLIGRVVPKEARSDSDACVPANRQQRRRAEEALMPAADGAPTTPDHRASHPNAIA